MALNKNEKVAVFVAVVVALGFLFLSYNLFTGDSGDDLLSNLLNTTVDTEVEDGQDADMKIEGLVMQDLQVGEGDEAVNGALITVHYIGTLDNGTVFDSSVERGEPFQFVLGAGQVIQGWEKGFVGMKIGGVRKLVIAPQLAYGDTQVGPIPANSILTFQVELLGVQLPE
jgi:FKBP-type peptidyl-prolyl cis-trans isomerase